MRIILDLNFISRENLPESNIFLTEIVLEMARTHHHHTFIFLSHEAVESETGLPENVSIHYINNNFLKWLGKRFWYTYILPNQLTRLKADLFVTIDNRYLKNTGIASCLFLIHLNSLLLQPEELLEKKRRSGFLVNRAIRFAGTVITLSEYHRRIIQTQSSVSAKKIKFLMPRYMGNLELMWTEKEMIKNEFARGMEYFVFSGELHERYDLLGLLKAFSSFKKWQQSNMQLLLVGYKSSWTGKFSEKLASFKYRQDVQLLVDLPKVTVQKIIGGAYAFVYPALDDHFPVNILKAMHAGVPVIATSFPVIEEWAGNTVMHPETNDMTGFAKSMQLIYKDERLRSGYIDAAKKQFSFNENYNMAEVCFKFFEEAWKSKS